MATPKDSNEEGGPDYLPDASVELAGIADITICHEGATLQLHSAVLASGSRVLRTALCGSCAGSSATTLCGSGSAESKSAAVQCAFEGHSLADVKLFLKLLYNTAAADEVETADDFGGMVRLVDKLDAPAVLQASKPCACYH